MHIFKHSAGAGCAALLSLMHENWHTSSRFSWCSPSGGLLSYELATHCSQFITSLVLYTDLETWLSVQSMEYSRDDALSIVTCVARNSKIFVKTGEDSLITGSTAFACAGTTAVTELLIRSVATCLFDGWWLESSGLWQWYQWCQMDIFPNWFNLFVMQLNNNAIFI